MLTIAVHLLVHFQFVKSKLQELQLGNSADELAPPYLPTEPAANTMNQTTILHGSQCGTIRAFFQGCQSVLDAFVIATPSELRHGPTVTFVRAVYAIKGLMLLQSALARTPHLRQVLSETEIQYQAYFGAMKRQLVTTSGDFSYKVPSKVLELTTFLADRDVSKTSYAGGHLHKGKGSIGDAANPSAEGDQGLVQGEEEDFMRMASGLYHDIYFPDSTSGEQYGLDAGMFQMPTLGDFSFLADQSFGVGEANMHDCWTSEDTFPLPGWPT